MPPQQTNITSGTGRDPAGLGLDLSIAVLNDALSEKDAAGRAAASPRSVLGLLKRYWRAFRDRLERQRLRTSLHDMSEKTLIDIGIPPGEIEHIAAHRAIDRLRDGTAHLWITSRGVM
jgi:uncharacterized protein YjiS (DUF1127 family)